MAVGSQFHDPETQAAIAAQGGTPAEPTPVEENPAVAEETPETPETETAEPSPEVSETEENADSPNMDDVQKPSQEEVDKALAEAGFSNEDLGQELADNGGKLTPETVAALKEKFDPTAVDNAVSDMESQWADKSPEVTAEAEAKIKATNTKIEAMNDHIYGSLAGGDVEKGKKHLETLSAWAKENVAKDTLDLINAKLASGNKALVDEGLKQAVGLWKKGQVRPMMSGDPAAAAAVKKEDTFQPISRDQFKALMATEKYQTDPEYAASVDARRRKSMEGEGYMTPEYSASRPPIS